MELHFRQIPVGSWFKYQRKLCRRMQMTSVATINAYNHTDCTFEYFHPFEVVQPVLPKISTDFFNGRIILIKADGTWSYTPER